MTPTIQTIACGSNHPLVIKAAKEFPAKLFAVHGDKIRIRASAVYFGGGNSKGSKGKGIDVSCTICGHEWSPRPNDLLQGHGCAECKRLKNINSAGKRRCPPASKEEKVRAIELKAAGLASAAVAKQLFDEGLSPQLRDGKTINLWTNPEQREKNRQRIAKRRQDPVKREQNNANRRRHRKEFEHGIAASRASGAKRRALQYEALFYVYLGDEEDKVEHEVNCYEGPHLKGGKGISSFEESLYFVDKQSCEDYASLMSTAKEMELEYGEKFEVDHLIPLSRGGLHHTSNFHIKTKAANSSKLNKRLPEDDALFCKRIFNIN